MEEVSDYARHVADWVVQEHDNGRRPFIIIDKVNAKVFVFDRHGQLRGAAPALLGLAKGDTSIAGIGDMKLSAIPPKDRTTPAGRFRAWMGRAQGHGKHKILWVDYADAISLHAVATGNPKERRQERLDTPTVEDNRISFGCINVPTDFFNTVVAPAFARTPGIVYVLPEDRPDGTKPIPENWPLGFFFAQ